MKRRQLLSFALLLSFGSFGSFGSFAEALTVTLPAKTFSALVAEATEVRGMVGACPSGETVVAGSLLDREGNRWSYWWQPDNRKIVMALWVKDGAKVDAVGFGVTDEKDSDAIPPLVWREYDPAKDGEGPCTYLVGPKKSEA